MTMSDSCTIIGLTWTLAGLCIFALAARLYTRWKTLSKWLSEDWIMLLGLLLQLVFQATVTINWWWGLGRPQAELVYFPQIENVVKWNWIGSIPGVVASVVSRVGAGLTLVRIFETKKYFKRFVYTATIAETLAGILVLGAILSQTSPFEAIWNPTVEKKHVMGRNFVKYTAYFFFSIALLMDLTFVVWPVKIIWDLNMPLRRRVGLCILLAMSLVTLAAGLAKVVYYSRGIELTNTDIDIDGKSVIWTSIESSFVIIMACLPIIPGFLRIVIPQLRNFGSELKKSISSSSSYALHKLPITFSRHSPRQGGADIEKQAVEMYANLSIDSLLIVSEPPEVHKQDSDGNHNIWRTDRFSVTYD
ncbi:hypothetical protein F5Y18DRAFT_371486 [Xylariaceae sp. FL1019]|nr:hypothetical protein F5Y18DRAFT_371486 [Xylariaceae sp. FL1019]